MLCDGDATDSWAIHGFLLRPKLKEEKHCPLLQTSTSVNLVILRYSTVSNLLPSFTILLAFNLMDTILYLLKTTLRIQIPDE